jgi:REP element-mobilizing transposase RayT
MKRDFIEFQERSVPKGFLITIRCYGTWLHGDERGSVNRRSFNSVGFPGIRPNESLERSDKTKLISRSFLFGPAERSIVEVAIIDVCKHKSIGLPAVNVRTNHAHAVTIASSGPERIMNSFKSYSTRRLREAGLVESSQKVWSRHGSTRWLWTEEHVEMAVHYVLYGQGDELPMFE